jgi:hypothetical protein
MAFAWRPEVVVLVAVVVIVAALTFPRNGLSRLAGFCASV